LNLFYNILTYEIRHYVWEILYSTVQFVIDANQDTRKLLESAQLEKNEDELAEMQLKHNKATADLKDILTSVFEVWKLEFYFMMGCYVLILFQHLFLFFYRAL